MRTAVREVQFALRRLLGSPGFTLAATLTLAIAIGATASVFAVVDGVLLKALPYRAPDRVFALWETSPDLPQFPHATMSPMDYLDYRTQGSAFASLAAWQLGQVTVTGKHEPERVVGLTVVPSYFQILGLTPVLGRTLAPDSGGPDEVVISYGYWRRRFGGAQSVLGQTLILDAKPYTIVGVLPGGVPGPGELWARMSFGKDALRNRAAHYLSVYGRLEPGVTPDAAQRAFQAIARRLATTYPQTNQNWSVVTVPLLDQLVGDVRPALLMLLAAATCVLLIGAANLANLFLVRCLARQRDLAVRTALGATRGRLVRELSVEAGVLGLLGGALGVGLAVAGVRGLRALAPSTLPRLSEVGVDGRVLAFCALASIATVFIFGLLPAWQTSRGNLASILKEGGRGTGSAQSLRLQDVLVVVQLAVALVLLTGAGLLVASFDHFVRMDPGFRPAGVLTATADLPFERYRTPDQAAAFAAKLAEDVAAEPGVQTASVSSALPGSLTPLLLFNVVGDPATDLAHTPSAYTIAVSPSYFRTLGITVRRGRGVLPTDDAKAVKVAVVDELLARRFFAGRDPLAQRIVFGPDTMQIVGVVATVKQGGLAAPDAPEVYAPLSQNPDTHVQVALRTSGDPEAQTAALKRAVANLDPTVPVSDVKTLSALAGESLGTTRFASFLASLFAVVALILGMVGVYSVLSYIVTQREREIAVRLALGASHTDVMGNVLRRALQLTGIGIAVGSLATWWLTRGLAGLFLGVSPHNPGIFVGAALVFAVVALIAAAVPAYRTTRVSPMSALKST